VWDLDGTLIQFKLDYQRARRVTKQILESHGLPTHLLTGDHFIIQMIQIASNYFEHQLHLELSEIYRIKQLVDKAVIEVEADAANQARPMDGIINVLDSLQANNLKMGILTYNTKQNTILSLEKAGLSKYFRDQAQIVGRDCVQHSKPHPDHINCLLTTMKLVPDEICVIGDHPRDIEAAINVHARSIAIISREHTPKEFQTSFICYDSEIKEKLIPLVKGFMD
jgi:phosphoglycolate phosphatase-like HAD superfamily hydrolase